MAFTETGQDIPSPYMPADDFKHEYLNIVFRSSSHISTVTDKLIGQEQVYRLPLTSKPIEFPGCFTAQQRLIEVKQVKRLEDVSLRETVGEDNCQFKTRLLVILSERQNNFADQQEQNLKATLMATEVVHCCRMADVECISGAEFQSVIVAIDKWNPQLLPRALTMAISRAQYQVVIIVDKSWTKPKFIQKLSQDLLPLKKNHETLFQQFLNTSTDLIYIFRPQDTYTRKYWFFKQNLGKHLEENGTELVIKKSISDRLQLTVIYPQHFPFPSSTTPAGTKQNKWN